jgi:hypothetical protein
MQIDCHVNADIMFTTWTGSVFADPATRKILKYTMFENETTEDDTFEDDISTDVEEAPDFPGLDFLVASNAL